MMFEGHTEGPWKATDDVGGNHYCPDGEHARPPQPCPHDLDTEGSWSIDGPPTTGWVGDHDTSLARRADAELAAAAPDLLALVRALVLPNESVTVRSGVLDDRQTALLRDFIEEART